MSSDGIFYPAPDKFKDIPLTFMEGNDKACSQNYTNLLYSHLFFMIVITDRF